MILSQVKAYHRESGSSVVLVSHSMEDIAKFADKVLVLQDGTVAMYDTTENVFARADELVQMGLSVPQVTQIFMQLRSRGVEIPLDVYTVPYAVKTICKALEERGNTEC